MDAITTIIKEFGQCKKVPNIIVLYYWMSTEYKNHWALSIDDAENTLIELSKIHPEFKEHIDVLLLNIDTCGILQSYYDVAMKLLDQSNASSHFHDVTSPHTPISFSDEFNDYNTIKFNKGKRVEIALADSDGNEKHFFYLDDKQIAVLKEWL